MAERNVYYVDQNNNLKVELTDFPWSKVNFHGNYRERKQGARNNSISLQKSFLKKHKGYKPLEISSASSNYIGKQASAMNLHVNTSHGNYVVEQLFQAGKTFKNHGSLNQYVNLQPVRIKHIASKYNHVDQLVGFQMFGKKFPLTPKTFYYDWIYLHGLIQNQAVIYQVLHHNAFTDIYANPKYTINSQAKSCALFVSLIHKYGWNKVVNTLRTGNADQFKMLAYPSK